MHLSYPFVFKYQNKYDMLPQRETIAYWEAESFPFDWKYHSTAYHRTIHDATIVSYQGHDGGSLLFNSQARAETIGSFISYIQTRL
jgi:hypothetical protein